MLQVQQNTEDGIALLQTAEGGLEEIQKLLERLRDLATQASNGTYDADAREAMQAEADEILEQIEQIRNVTSYNGKNLFETEQNSNTPVSRLSNSVRSASPSALMSSRVMSISDEDTVSGAFDFSSGETKTVIMSNEDYLEPAKAIYKFSKDNDFYKIKGGVIEGKVMTAEEIITLAKLPSRETLLSMLAGALLGNISKLAVALDQVKVQKESAEA